MYEAIFIPECVSAPSKDIINQPDLQVYVKDFGKNKGDLCLVAQVSDKIVSAVWVRIMNDYGHIDNETPSFAISLLKEYRNYGIGTELIKSISFIRITSTPMRSTSSSESGTGFEPGPTNPVTPRVFLTMYQLSSVIIILIIT